MTAPKSEIDGSTSAPSRSHRDFATVCAGYLAGHGVLRLFAGILTGLGDNARAELLLRWLPVWNALGFVVLAWAVYRLLIWLGATPMAPTTALRTRIAENQSAAPFGARSPAPRDWKVKLKAAQKREDVEAILELQKELVKALAPERAAILDRRLAKWYTKHFQRMMLNGRAAESAAQVELVAKYYSDSDEFAYFREILPVVRQCAELKQSLKDEEDLQ